jgi:hypothetical protein
MGGLPMPNSVAVDDIGDLAAASPKKKLDFPEHR